MDIPTTEPTEVRAGDTIKWDRNDLSSDYPASSWTLTYTIINASNKYTVTASANGEHFRVNVDDTVSANWVAGDYKCIARVSDGSDSYTIDEGTLEILPDLTALSTADRRSHAKKMLDMIEACLENRATDEEIDIVGHAIGGRSLTKDPDTLKRWRTDYRIEYEAQMKKERRDNGRATGARTLVRFND